MQERITEAELRTIYGDTIDALYGYASRKCGGERELAEDVTQEVWLRAVREWRRSGAPDSPQAWLITVARNLILNHLRKQPSVSIDSVSPSEMLAAVEANTLGDSAEIATQVNRALTRMPEAEATLLEAFHFERLTMSQLARVLGISERAVEGRLRRARERLRKVMTTMAIVIITMASITVGASQRVDAQTTDVIRGRVTGPDSLPVQGANVRATSSQGNVSKTATTDRNGRYTIVFINGEGDYWLDFIKLGFAPKRFEIRKLGEEEVMIADARMTSTIATLDAMNVVGQRDRALPNRSGASPDVGGGDRALNPNGVPADQAGNLAAMAAAIAGIQLIPGLDGAADMFSVLGLSGDQNNTTFNGLGSGINTLPPDILASTSIKPYPFDVSIGGFSGAQITIQTIPGSNFSRRGMTHVNITPPLEWTDESADAQGQKFTNARLGGNGAGPLVMDEAFYNVAYNVGRRFSDAHTLLNTPAVGLSAAGVAGDSVTRLLDALRAQNIPFEGGVPSVQGQNVAQGAVNLDWMPSASGAGHSFTLGVAGNYARSAPVSRGGLLLATPAHTGATDNWGGNLALVHTNYFWFGVFSRTTLGVAGSGGGTAPFHQLPEGVVRVNSMLPDGSSSIKTLSFGGTSSSSSLGSRALQFNNQLSWYSGNNRHTLKVTTNLAGDAYKSDVSPNLLGSYSYNSLADLDANRPAAFVRTLTMNTRAAKQIVGAVSFGDYWRPSTNVQLQYGVRIEGNRFLSTPGFNQGLLDALHTRNDNVPNRLYVSPRLGVQWYYGQPSTIAYVPGAARPPRAVVHAGIGAFQNIASAQLIGSAMSATGLPSSTQSVTCIGSAVPLPIWSTYQNDRGAIPARCADGTAGSVFGTSAPSVTTFAPNYRQPRSLRAAGDWSSPVLDNRFVLGVQAIASEGLAQQGLVDINLTASPRFTLETEGGRPVFADATAIVPATGSVSLTSSRIASSFQSVWERRSDLRERSRQLTANLKPVTARSRLKWDLSYTLLDVAEQFNGFTSTGGNPRDVAWGPELQGGRHQFVLRWSDFPIRDIVYVTAGLLVSSGPKYTPMIAGDVNGDGALNDRAFVFDQAGLSVGSNSAKRCLAAQANRIAERGSCQASWRTQAGLVVKFNPLKIGLPKRASVSLQLQNPLGLADLALHGSSGIHGWGQAIPPDQNLLFVRGFDPVARQFTYEVNERFGSTSPRQSTTHVLPYISVSVMLDVGAPRERQLLTQRLDNGRSRPGTKLPAPSMKQLASSSIPNPMDMILQQADSLALTRRQADDLATLSHRYAVFADSVWTPVASYLAQLPDTYSHGDAYDRYVSARERTVDHLLTLVSVVTDILTPSQRRKLPSQIANYLDVRVLRFLRSSTAGDNSGVVIR